ncbi:MAG TPA: (2Fe-2S)-binding protein [Acetobacteraceae bacterium]|nr:(2Fe-2S)-binding protein [Acetobacteraceae bacterium]
MFRRLPEVAARPVSFVVDGEAAEGCLGESVAAALLAAGRLVFRRTAVGGVARGPFCMMGACFDCLVEIDGVGNRQACLVPLKEGMDVRTQDGRRALGR